MTLKTRYFVIVSLLVLIVGVGTGLVAYYVGLPLTERRATLAELQFMPDDAAVVAYANVRDVMASDLRRRIRQAVPHQDGRREFEDKTGINIETDIDRVVACLDAPQAGEPNTNGLVMARGRFNEVKIEALMREHGADADTYKGKRLIVSPSTPNANRFALAFIEPGLAAIGSARLVRHAIDLQDGGKSAVDNPELMNLVRSLDTSNAWAVGRFDVLRSSTKLPAGMADRLPPITLFSVSGHVNGGIKGMVRAETRDEGAAKNLREVVRGFLALAKLQAGSNPQVQTALQSLELGGTGTTVALSFTVPGEIFDSLQPGGRAGH